MGKLKNIVKKVLDRDIRRVKVEVYHDIKYVKTHIPKVIASSIVLIFFIILFVLFKTKQGDKFNHSDDTMLTLANTKAYIIKPSKVKDILQANLKDYQIIDIRSSQEQKIFKIDNSILIPFERILEDKHKGLWDNDTKKILACKNEIESTQAWLILSELGYKNILVLEGGIDYWKDFTKSIFRSALNESIDEEKPKFDYKKIMKDLKGSGINTTSSTKKRAKKVIKRKKKKAGGGCG